MPVMAIAVRSARNYFKEHFHALDSDVNVMIDCKINEGSEELKTVYDPKRRLANDTSFGVGYAPLTESERLALDLEHYMNGELKKKLPEVGEDVKIMVCRNENKVNVTVASAMIDSYIPDKDHYLSVKNDLKDELLDFTSKHFDIEVSLEINTADEPEHDVFYLTVTGLSMENGDDGSVGRGNRVNGLITPHRLMSLEAACGKNPVTHVGKLYQVLSKAVAEDIYKEHEDELEEVYVHMLSQIGRKINDPQNCSVFLTPHKGIQISKIRGEVEGLVEEKLSKIDELTDKILREEVTLF
jgi:S-adenosylmethionine synthetase